MEPNLNNQLKILLNKIKNDQRPLSPTAKLSFKEKLFIIEKLNKAILTLKKGETGVSE